VKLGPNSYPAGVKVAVAELASINLQRHDFHGGSAALERND